MINNINHGVVPNMFHDLNFISWQNFKSRRKKSFTTFWIQFSVSSKNFKQDKKKVKVKVKDKKSKSRKKDLKKVLEKRLDSFVVPFG